MTTELLRWIAFLMLANPLMSPIASAGEEPSGAFPNSADVAACPAERDGPQEMLNGVFVDPARVAMLSPLRIPKGPRELPDKLAGIWKVSICATRHHTWIRFENVHTHEVRTLGRFQKGAPGLTDSRTGQAIIPPLQESGVHMDLDLMFEDEIRSGRFILLSVILKNPTIYRGGNNGFGYTFCRQNCTSYARGAWQFYSGEDYPQLWLDMPEDFAYFIWKRHPQVPFAKRLGYQD
jgi:hypothetical protein